MVLETTSIPPDLHTVSLASAHLKRGGDHPGERLGRGRDPARRQVEGGARLVEEAPAGEARGHDLEAQLGGGARAEEDLPEGRELPRRSGVRVRVRGG